MNRPVLCLTFGLCLLACVAEFAWALQDTNNATKKQSADVTQSEIQVDQPEKRPVRVLDVVKEDDNLPRVLLIGDSISMGYTLDVRQFLQGKANVQRPSTNCGPTTRGLAQLDQWLKTGDAKKQWNVIHFNWGLHDLKYIGKGGANLADPDSETSRQQVPPEQYRKNLTELVKRLKETKAKLIWRNTTPVPEGAKGRVVGDSIVYNKIAAEIMQQEKVQIHDLYSFALDRKDKIQRPADVHYTKDGSRQLAEEVARVINAALAEEK